ncbi:hypothetical protein LOD99_14713 [Oopsacas minuta]|uniref:Uncharacterized protein n=1 Tax=Oopsacas minuta TaxID=111878 RepID=A0AAV7KCY3_9METZ|nr:hypothetical protein LOD99_14713 [Oopsacas minuta]
MSNKDAKQNGEVSRCTKCISLTKEVKSQENKRIDQFLFFKQKIINFDNLIRTLLQQKSIVENDCRALKAQVDHLWPCQQENEQLKESKREIDETVVDLKTELDSKETTIFQLNAKFSEAEKEKISMYSVLDVYKVAYRDEKKKNERLQQKLNKSKEINQDKRKLAKLLKDATQKQSNAEEKLQNLKTELVAVRKESKKAEKEWKSQYKLKLKQRLQLVQSGVLSDLDSSTNATPRHKRRRVNPPSSSPHLSPYPEGRTPSNLVPQPSDDSSQSSSDSDMTDVSQISSVQSINIFQSLEDAIQWTLPAMSPLRSHTPEDTLDSSLPIGASPLPNLSPLHSPNLSLSPTRFNPLNDDLQLSSSSQSASSSSNESSPGSSPSHTPPLSPSLRKKLLKSKSHSERSLSPLSPSPGHSNSTPSCSSRVTRSIAKQLKISIPSLQENTPDPPKVTHQHSRSRTTSENTLSDIISPTRVRQLFPTSNTQLETSFYTATQDISSQSDISVGQNQDLTCQLNGSNAPVLNDLNHCTESLPMETLPVVLSQCTTTVSDSVISTTTLDVITESREIELSPGPSEDSQPPTTRSKAKLAEIAPVKHLSPPYTPVATPRRSPRLSSTPDAISPIIPSVFLMPPTRPPIPTTPPQSMLHHMSTKQPARVKNQHTAIRTDNAQGSSKSSSARKNSNLPTMSPSKTRSVKRKRKSKMRKSKTQCMHSIERDRQSKPVNTNPSERRVVELPRLPRRGSRQLTKPPSSSKILSEYFKETSVTSQKLTRPTDAITEFSQMKTKKVSNIIALSDEQSTEEICRNTSINTDDKQASCSEVVVVIDTGIGVGESEGESDVEMGKGPTKRVVGRGRRRRRIKSKVYISESDENCSDKEETIPFTPTYNPQEIGLVEETVTTENIEIIPQTSTRIPPTLLSIVTDYSVCLKAERMRTLFSISATRNIPKPVYSLDSLGFYDITPAQSTADIIQIKKEFVADRCEDEFEQICVSQEVVDLTDDVDSDVDDITQETTQSIPSDSDGDVYVSPLPSPLSSSASSFKTPSSSSLKRRPINRPHSPLPSSRQLDTSVNINVRMTRSGTEYRSYLTTDFSNEESSLPFANFLSQTNIESPPHTETITSSEVVQENDKDIDDKMDITFPVINTDIIQTDSFTDKQTVNSSNYWESFLAESNTLTENTTITELMSSYTFSSQSTSELFQATKTKFEAQSSKQKQRPNQSRNRNKSGGKRVDNFPAKRGYVVGQGDTQYTDSDEEIDCMLQELRDKKETAKKKPDRPKTATKKIVVIGALKRNEEQSPYAFDKNHSTHANIASNTPTNHEEEAKRPNISLTVCLTLIQGKISL